MGVSTKQDQCAMAVAAHPDDIEFLMAGTMLLLGQAGFSLHYLNIANGSCGSVRHDAETVTRIRRDEARRAADLLGATFHESVTNDVEIFYDRPTLAQVASVIRAVGPNILGEMGSDLVFGFTCAMLKGQGSVNRYWSTFHAKKTESAVSKCHLPYCDPWRWPTRAVS